MEKRNEFGCGYFRFGDIGKTIWFFWGQLRENIKGKLELVFMDFPRKNKEEIQPQDFGTLKVLNGQGNMILDFEKVEFSTFEEIGRNLTGFMRTDKTTFEYHAE